MTRSSKPWAVSQQLASCRSKTNCCCSSTFRLLHRYPLLGRVLKGGQQMRNKVICAATLIAAAIPTLPFVRGNNTGNGAEIARVESGAAQSQNRVTVPAGTRILIRTVDSIDSSKQKAGFRFTPTLETNLQAEDSVVARRGTTVYGRLAQASSEGRMKGSSELT